MTIVDTTGRTTATHGAPSLLDAWMALIAIWAPTLADTYAPTGLRERVVNELLNLDGSDAPGCSPQVLKWIIAAGAHANVDPQTVWDCSERPSIADSQVRLAHDAADVIVAAWQQQLLDRPVHAGVVPPTGMVYLGPVLCNGALSDLYGRPHRNRLLRRVCVVTGTALSETPRNEDTADPRAIAARGRVDWFCEHN